jgi:hypothetical protein
LVLDHLAQYETVLALEAGALPDTPENLVKGYCDEMNATAVQSMPGTGPGAEDRAEQAARVVRVGEMRYLGVVAIEPLACYSATLHKFSVENAGEITQATVITALILKGKIIISYLFAPYAGHETIPKLLTTQRAHVSQLQRANRN